MQCFSISARLVPFLISVGNTDAAMFPIAKLLSVVRDSYHRQRLHLVPALTPSSHVSGLMDSRSRGESMADDI